MAEQTFTSLLAKARELDGYWAAKAVHEFTEDLCRLMEQRGVSKSELARRIGSSPAYVTKALRGNTNFTIDSMIRLVRALDGRLCLHVGRSEDQTQWFDITRKRSTRSTAGLAPVYRLVDETSSMEPDNPEAHVDAFYPAAA